MKRGTCSIQSLMSCLLTLQTEGPLTHWREMSAVIRHTHSLQAAIHYIHNHVQWHAPSWNIRIHTHTHTYQQSWVNRVQFLLLPWSNNGSSITSLTTQTVPREREGDAKREGERKAADRDRRGSRLKKSSQQNRLARKKEAQTEKREKERDPVTYRTYCRVLQGFVSIEVATQKLYFITWIQITICKQNWRCACNCLSAFACVVWMNMTMVCVCLCTRPHVCEFVLFSMQLVLPSSVLYIRKWPARVLSPSFWHKRVQSPCKDTTFAWNKPPLCFPSSFSSSFSFCISCLPCLSRKRSSSLPSSLPPCSPPVIAVWAFITPLPPSSFYLSIRMKESVREYVWGSIPYVHNCLRVCVG